jgi:lipopolysaccharide export system permease protein
MLPPATLIAVIIMFSSMRKRNEITAVKACGLNIFKLSQKIVVASFFLGVAVFLFSETVVPYTSFRSNKIWNIDVEKQDPGLFYGSHQIWYRGHDSIYWIRHFDFKDKTMQNPTFYFFDKAFRLIKRIDGRKGVWDEGKWKIDKGVIQEIKADGGYELKKFDTHLLDIHESPEAFVKGMKKPEEMSYWQLKRYAKQVREEGYDNTRYLVDMNIKVAFPFISLVLVFIGIPIALGLRKGGTPLAISLGMAVCFSYVLTMGFSRSLGLSGVLPPLLSAWLANLGFLFLGIYLMMHVES